MPGRIEKTVFIRYRRTNLPWALFIWQNLTMHGYDAFFDYQNIDSGDFEKVILENIRASAHFVVILTPSALDRCRNPGDWLRREIETAIDEKRNIVPLMMEGFDFASQLVTEVLTGKLATLRSLNGLSVPDAYALEAMSRLRERYLNKALNDVAMPSLPVDAQEITEMQKAAASRAALVDEEQLTAQTWFERGYVFTVKTGNMEEAIRCLSEAIRLEPTFAAAFFGRGLARRRIDDLDGAIQDYSEAIRLKPDYPEAYHGRGIAFSMKGDNNRALSDFQKARELNPDFGGIRSSLARALKSLGRREEAQEQEKAARELIQKEDEYSRACFEAICGNVDEALRLLSIALAKDPRLKKWTRQDPDFANIRDDPRFNELVAG
ncbi:MAG TPA: toll/interleukin-1 receptor domain-containing protein [Anaerolineales bacterium]|nr:toll/interleukin-1 receptor domain-containing protein [Anaerolineales bacterium]